MNNNNINELSIQVNLNGLSFCILHTPTNTITYLNTISFETKLNPFDTLNRLKSELSSNTVFADNFKKVHVIHQNELSALIPKDLYDHNNKADYLKFNAKILKTDYITEDSIESINSYNVYIPYININNYIFDAFGEFTYKHSSTVLIDTVLNQLKSDVNETRVYIHVHPFTIEILVIENGQLQLSNVFEYHTNEDFIYYVLFVFDQLQIDVETAKVLLSGTIDKGTAIFELLYTYIRHVDILENDFTYQFSNNIDTHKLHYHYLILNSF